ncbi:MAG: site-specific integrase [Thermoguttaceae bacterium]
MLTLEWNDIDWERDRFRAHSPKTEHHPGKASRVIPLFPELRAILTEAFEAAEDGAVYVIGNDAYRKASNTPGGWRNCNLRTQFGRILKRAGLEPWPRLFHALRASRETELAGEYPVHVVTGWLGNTPKIAMKHYLMTTESDFSKAIGKLVQMAVQNPVQSSDNSGAKSGAAASQGVSQEAARNAISRCETTAYAKSCDDFPRPTRIISGEDRKRTNPVFLGKSRGGLPRRRKIQRTSRRFGPSVPRVGLDRRPVAKPARGGPAEDCRPCEAGARAAEYVIVRKTR